MRSINSVFITGNLTRDPDVKATASGLSVLEFVVAVNVSRRLQDGSYEDRAIFVPVKAFGRQAEFLSGRLSKGVRVTVSGRLDQRRWEDQDGRRRSVMEVIAEDVEFPTDRMQAQTTSDDAYSDDEIPF